MSGILRYLSGQLPSFVRYDEHDGNIIDRDVRAAALIDTTQCEAIGMIRLASGI